MVDHTPGTWTIEEYGDSDTPDLVIHNGSEIRICFMATPGSHGDPAKIEANARLIAAAPEMLAALRDYITECTDVAVSPTWPRLPEIRASMRAAIAKAEGHPSR